MSFFGSTSEKPAALRENKVTISSESKAQVNCIPARSSRAAPTTPVCWGDERGLYRDLIGLYRDYICDAGKKMETTIVY